VGQCRVWRHPRDRPTARDPLRDEEAIQMKMSGFMMKDLLTDEQRTKMGFKLPK
jgi:hypothetical protein